MVRSSKTGLARFGTTARFFAQIFVIVERKHAGEQDVEQIFDRGVGAKRPDLGVELFPGRQAQHDVGLLGDGAVSNVGQGDAWNAIFFQDG